MKNEDAKTFIFNNLQEDLAKLSLLYAGKTAYNITICLQLIALYRKAKNKLPLFFQEFLAIDNRSYEQATSQRIAIFKQKIIYGNTLVDLTAGIGVDSLFLSKSFDNVVAIEQNIDLHELAVYNLQVLGINNVTRVCGDGTKVSQKADWFYIDPDRRPGEKRAVKLENLEPNVLELLPLLKKWSTKTYIKLSPLFDVDEVWHVFSDAEKIVILAENSEIKEVGVILSFDRLPSIKTIYLADVVSGFTYQTQVLKKISARKVAIPVKNYLLVPHVLLIKARLASEYLENQDFEQHPEFGYYFSENEVMDIGFRTFRILSETSFNDVSIRTELKNLDIKQLNIIIKGLNDQPAKWHKKLNTKDGGIYYLFLLKGKVKQAFIAEFISF